MYIVYGIYNIRHIKNNFFLPPPNVMGFLDKIRRFPDGYFSTYI